MHPVRMMAVGLGAAALLLVAGITLASAADAPAPPLATAGNERSLAGPPADDSRDDCTPVIGVDPGILDFGNVETGQVLDLDLDISNDESGAGCALTIDNISLSINPGGVFELLNLPSFPAQVIVGTPLTIQVRFAPAVAGIRQGQVLIESDATNEPEQTVTLQGVGVVQPTESITVTVPNGGEEYAPEDMPEATWTTVGTVPNVDIDLSTDGGTTWVPLGQDETNGGSFSWLVPNTPTTQALIRVQDADDGIPSDTSDAPFTINGVQVTRPNGGESFQINSSEQITWSSFGAAIANVRIELSTDNGSTWTDIIASTANSGTFDWTVAGSETSEALVRISDAANAAANDISDNVFNIVPEGQNAPPQCDAGGAYAGTVDQPVSFDGSNSTDTDGTIVRYDWDFGDGSTAPDAGATPSHTYTTENTYTVTLTVTDDDDDFTSCSATAEITTGGGEFPTCSTGGPYDGEPDEAVSFDGSASTDPDGTIVSYAWEFGDGGTGTGPTPTHTYTAEGTFTVTLTVTDDDAQSSNCETTATIVAVPNQDPECDAGGPYAGAEGSPINFDGRGSFDPDGTIVSYAWQFGDGGTGTGPTPSHTYTTASTYTVTLTVTDDDDASTSCSTSAEVIVPGEQVNVAVPPKVFGSRNDDIRVPIFVEDDLTGLGVLSTEFSITYDPQVLFVENVNLAGTIGEGGTVEWHVRNISRHEEIVRVSIAWVTPIEDCEEMAYVVFQATNNTEDRSPLDLEILFNEGDPEAVAHDGEFIKHILGDVNCSGNISPLDASLTLQIAVGRVHIPDQRYPCLSVDVADVTGNGTVTGFDASFIQRFAIGAIDNFPVEDLLECERFLAGGTSSSFLAGETTETATPHAVSLETSAAVADGSFEITVGIDDLAHVFGGDFEVTFDESALRVVEVTPLVAGEGAIAESHVEGGAVRLSVALAETTSGPADLARVRFAHLDPGAATASRIDLSRAELNEGEIPVSTFGVVTPLPSAGTAVDSLEVVVPLRAFGARLADVEVPVFVRDDVTGLEVYSADIVIGYDPAALEGRGVDLDDTIGDGGIAGYNVVRIAPDREEMRVSVAWTNPIAGCGTFAKVLFQATLESTAPDPRTSPLDLQVVFNEGDPPVKTESGTFIRALLGDVNASSNLSPIDASLILQYLAGRFRIPNEHYPNFVLVVADVSANGEIRAFDAALILQKILGIIEFFPGENIGLECNNGGFGRSMPVAPSRPRELALSWLVEGGVAEAVLELSDGTGVLGIEASLSFDPSVLRVIEVIDSRAGEGSLLETSLGDGRLALAAARARAAEGKTEVVRVRFERLAEGETEVRIEAPVLNEGTMPVVVRSASLGSPGAQRTDLWQNRPNPFNPATDIGFVIGAPSLVDLAVFDLAGRRVRTLVRDHLPAGEHLTHWDGRDEAGQPVAAGIYLYTLDAAGSRMTKKMLLIK